MSRYPKAQPAPVAPVQPPTPQGLGGWAKTEKKPYAPKRKSAGVAASSMRGATLEAERRGHEDDWEGTRPLVFVAAYARLHQLVYGIAPAELGPTECKMATFAAARMLKREFVGDATAMAAFIQWAWRRESGRETWRRQNGRQGFRMTWRLLFGGHLLTDMRLEEMRRAGKR